ncbi:hypothetical protein J3F83DRAFT_9272 [Trichoderma novae-zelandiae]
MSEGDESRGAGQAGDANFVREVGMSTPLLATDGGGYRDGDENGEENVSETSTLLPTSQASPPPAGHAGQRHESEGVDTYRSLSRIEQSTEGEEEAASRRTTRTRLGIFRGETIVRMLMLAGMAAMVVIAVVRALGGGFSPGLVGGGGLMMVLCFVVCRREVRGRLMRD